MDLHFIALRGRSAAEATGPDQRGARMVGMTSTSEAEYVAKRVEALQAVVSEPVLGALALNRRGL